MQDFSQALIIEQLHDIRNERVLVMPKEMSQILSALANSRASVKEADPGDIPEGQFDLIISSLTFSEVDDIRPDIKKMINALASKGSIILTDFHPFLVLSSSARSFLDLTTGKRITIGNHLHFFAEYVLELKEHGFNIDFILEPERHHVNSVFLLKASRL